MSKIKDIYKKCSLRVVTPVDEGTVGIGFNLDSGEIVRLCVPVSAVMDIYRLTTTQSPGSSGKPISDVSSGSPVSL